MGQSASGSELLLGIRPSNVEVWNQEPPGDRIESEVYVKQPMGTETVLSFKIGETYLNAKVPASTTFDRGDKVWLTLNKKAIHLFDAKNQRAIL
jgi:multiple sugar transport system ATP-binding protein